MSEGRTSTGTAVLQGRIAAWNIREKGVHELQAARPSQDLSWLIPRFVPALASCTLPGIRFIPDYMTSRIERPDRGQPSVPRSLDAAGSAI